MVKKINSFVVGLFFHLFTLSAFEKRRMVDFVISALWCCSCGRLDEIELANHIWCFLRYFRWASSLIRFISVLVDVFHFGDFSSLIIYRFQSVSIYKWKIQQKWQQQNRAHTMRLNVQERKTFRHGRLEIFNSKQQRKSRTNWKLIRKIFDLVENNVAMIPSSVRPTKEQNF